MGKGADGDWASHFEVRMTRFLIVYRSMRTPKDVNDLFARVLSALN